MDDYDLDEEVDWRKIFFIDFSTKRDIFNTVNERKAIMQIFVLFVVYLNSL